MAVGNLGHDIVDAVSGRIGGAPATDPFMGHGGNASCFNVFGDEDISDGAAAALCAGLASDSIRQKPIAIAAASQISAEAPDNGKETTWVTKELSRSEGCYSGRTVRGSVGEICRTDSC